MATARARHKISQGIDDLLAEIRSKDATISLLREQNTELRKQRRVQAASNADMRRRLASMTARYGKLDVDPSDVIPDGKGLYRAVADRLEIDHTDVRSIAAGIDPPHLHLAVIRRARTLLTSSKDTAA